MPAKKKKTTASALEKHKASKKANGVGSVPTPKYYVEKKGQFEYVDEAYMRRLLNDAYPDKWSWTIISYQLCKDGSSSRYFAIAVHGRLSIETENGGRHFDAIASHQASVSQKTGDYVDFGNDMKAASTDAFKVAVNRLCNVADDVYRKGVLSVEQLDTLEGLFLQAPSSIQRKVVRGIATKEINPLTFTDTITRLDSIISEQSKTKGKNKNG